MTRNRPYSVLQIFENLRGEFARPALQSAADVLAAGGELRTKAYGKAAIYFPNQAHMPAGIAPAEAKALFDEAEALKLEAHQIETVALPALQALRRELLGEPTNAALRHEYKDLKVCREGGGGGALGWHGRRRVVRDDGGASSSATTTCASAGGTTRSSLLGADQICISRDGAVAEAVDEIGVDTDEANRAALPPPRKKART